MYARKQLLVAAPLNPAALPLIPPPPMPPPFVFYKFNASLTIIIAVLVMAFFFMGMVALYVWRCSSDEHIEAALQAAGVIRRPSTAPLPFNGAPASSKRGGLDRATLEKLFPVELYEQKEEEEEECAVCLVELQQLDKVRSLTMCTHTFHAKCIDDWLASHPSCPVCRSELCIQQLQQQQQQPHHSIDASA